MKHIIAVIPSLLNEKAKLPINAIAPDFSTSFGLHAVVFPQANHDLESHQSVAEGESEKCAFYMHKVVDHLYANLGGADFESLRRAINSKP